MSPNVLDSTRPRILSILKERGRASVEQLAQDLGLASTTIRRHLDILQRDRLVDLRQSREHAGRPQNHYFLTEEGLEAQPKGYGELLTLLLSEISCLSAEDLTTMDGDGLLKLLFARMAERVVTHSPRFQEEDPDARLSAVLDWLADKGFRPEMQRLDGTVSITLRNCPFRLGALSDQNVCLFDQNFISMMLRVPVAREQCIRGEDRICCYTTSLKSSH